MRSTPIAQPQRYTTKSIWLSSLRNIGGSQVMREIINPLVTVTVAAGLIACLQMFTGSLPGGRAGAA